MYKLKKIKNLKDQKPKSEHDTKILFFEKNIWVKKILLSEVWVKGGGGLQL